MRWSFVLVQISIIAVISCDSFPIDLMEIDNEDIYLVDQQRRGRFIQVNQTTFLPNPIELLRAKKSSKQHVEKSEPAIVMVPERSKKKEQQGTPSEPNLPTTHTRIPFNGVELMAQNNYTCADNLFEPQTFGYPSFFEDQFKVAGHLPHFPNPMFQMLSDDNCCDFDKFMSAPISGFPCIEEYVDPEANSFC